MDRGLIQACTNTINKFTDYASFKIIMTILYTTFSFLFDATQHAGLIALLLLIIADFTTAVSAAYKNHVPIKSGKVFITAVKVLIYFTLIACAHLVEKAVPLFSILDETVKVAPATMIRCWFGLTLNSLKVPPPLNPIT